MTSDPDYESRLDLHVKRGKVLIVNFIDCLEKCDFFANESKFKKIIYCWKIFFFTSMNSRSLPQNMALFGSDQLVKFTVFVLKCMPMIWALSSGTEVIILTSRSR